MDNNLSNQYDKLTINPSSEENIINSDLYAPNPVLNPQIINQNKPSPYIPSNKCPYEPNIQSQGNHPYNGNIPSNIYPYDQNNSPTQGFPYYNASPEPFPNNEESVENNLCISCNTNDNYFPKFNDSSNLNTFINCYNSAQEGY